MPTTLLLMLCTVPDRGTAERLAGMLVEQELAACVNLSAPITSIYRWQGKTEQSEEILLLIKTTKERYQACESALRAEHPYELPEIIAVPVEQGLDDYVNWVERCTNQSI
ncbi:MAG: divalent-cation tolerance protein CutA [Candidatus Thiodiazotropha sp. (ex. Lucinisca nassula)]|nr:divalent-cation tolerance protein CutA [Candidatus Thiodiazotropha sp. (ex. Lucinisca nassula)]MBW9260929.1 divalent-cation tolerance protein CutA [Candidatus Thiodiazotropha sp. (ex. Lucinisca nassula)]MBW9269778.1 divalent-cation tolerance protein CutA [Candidatus Thiodiazotropha sp. (ex. Lucinisca nassula)]